MADIIIGLGGPAGFGTGLEPQSDDGYWYVDLTAAFPHGLDFFGHQYSGFYLNNNGNITFEYGRYQYTPFSIPATTNNPEIDVFFGDVWTYTNGQHGNTGGNSAGTGELWYNIDTANH